MDDSARAKRQKTSSTNMQQEANPYLAHWNEVPAEHGYNNNDYTSTTKRSPLSTFKRHATTMAMAKSAEDGPQNAFNSNPLSERYFGILKTRRNLPVHAQRYARSIDS